MPVTGNSAFFNSVSVRSHHPGFVFDLPKWPVRMRLLGNNGLLRRVVGDEAAPGVRSLNGGAAMNHIGGPHQGGALRDMQQFSMQALGGENLFQAWGVAGSVRITWPQGLGILRKNQIIHAMTARIVKQLTGAGNNILKRDPTGGELIRRFDINESRILMTPLLGTILKIETLKRHRIVLENIGEEIENGRGHRSSRGRIRAACADRAPWLPCCAAGQSEQAHGGVPWHPDNHFDVAIEPTERRSHGFKKTVRRRACGSPVKDDIAVPTPHGEDVGSLRACIA